MNEIATLVISACVAMCGLFYVTYNNLDYKGYTSTHNCTGECYEEYVRENGTLMEQMEAKAILAAADEFSSIKGIWSGCAACHGAQGQGMAAFPKLAGQTSGYISEALTQYKNGIERGPSSVVMYGQASMLTDQQIELISRYIETL